MSTVTKKLEVKTPMVPNFLQVGKQVISIAEFSEEELESIGKSWTIRLIARAIEIKRNNS